MECSRLARLGLQLVLVVLLAAIWCPRAAAEEEEALPARVNRALKLSAAHLVEKQADDGSWRKDDAVHPLGRTALCTYSLLHAGYPEDHAAVQKALSFLNIGSGGYASGKVTPKSIYEAGCLVLLLHALGPQHDASIKRICEWIVSHFNAGVGLWGYPGGTPDMSNTQFACMALKVGALHGYDAPSRIWERLLVTVGQLQAAEGGVRYRAGSIYRGSMTLAGLLVLRYAQEELRLKKLPKSARRAEKAAERWFAEHYRVDLHPSGNGWTSGRYHYYLYALERYAQLFGYEKIAGHDWYAEGAEELLAQQEHSGSWGRLEQTCFAILFLRRVTLTSSAKGGVIGPITEEERPPRKDPAPKPADSVNYIRHWLVAGPYLAKRPKEDDMLTEKHFDVARASPASGSSAGGRKWVAYESIEPKIDMKDVLRVPGWCTFYAAVYLHAEEAADALVWLASDDGCKAYMNGEEVLDGHHHGYCGDDHYRVPVKLEKGRNLLLVRLENLEHYCYLRCRISDVEGAPIVGLVPTTRRKAPKRR